MLPGSYNRAPGIETNAEHCGTDLERVERISMRLRKQLSLLAAFLFMITCAYGQEIYYNYERGANFASYRTYQWIEIPSDAPKVDPPAAPPKLDLPRASTEPARSPA
jgi:hypothetical protein